MEKIIKILVPIKRVIDPYVKIRIKSDHTGVETHNVKMTINPFCAIALEAAVRFKESGVASEVIAVSIGENNCYDSLLTALALGADRALHINTQGYAASKNFELQPLNVSKLLAAIASQQQVDLVILGKQSIDTDNNQVPQMLAALLNWPQATFASNIAFQSALEPNEVEVTREVDAGLEKLAIQLPAVISTDLRLNEPRYASLPNIMKAKRKPFESIELSTFINQHQSNYDFLTSIIEIQAQTIIHVSSPTKRQKGERINSVDELIDKLKNHKKVI